MSETEHTTGKLFPVEVNIDAENTARLICEALGIEKPPYTDTYLEAVEDCLYGEYVVVGGVIYRYVQTELDPYSDIFRASRNSDGSIDYEVKYYNGGCGFSEAIEEALKTLEG